MSHLLETTPWMTPFSNWSRYGLFTYSFLSVHAYIRMYMMFFEEHQLSDPFLTFIFFGLVGNWREKIVYYAFILASPKASTCKNCFI